MPPRRNRNRNTEPIQDEPTGVTQPAETPEPRRNLRGLTNEEFQEERRVRTELELSRLQKDPAFAHRTPEELREIAARRAARFQSDENARAFFGVPEGATTEQEMRIRRAGEARLEAAIRDTAGTPTSPTGPFGSPETALQPQQPLSDFAIPTTQSRQQAGQQGAARATIDFGDLGLDQPRTAQLGQRMGQGGADSNEAGAGTPDISVPGVNVQTGGEVPQGTGANGQLTLTSEQGNIVTLTPTGDGGFTVGEGGTTPQQVVDVSSIIGQYLGTGDTGSFLEALKGSLSVTPEGTYGVAAPTVEFGGDRLPVQFVDVAPGNVITVNGEQIASGFRGAVIEVEPGVFVSNPAVTLAYEQAQLDQQIFGTILNQVGNLQAVDAQQRLDITLALLRPELELRNTLAAQQNQAALSFQTQFALNQQQFQQQTALQQGQQQFSAQENALQRRFEFGLTQMQQQFTAAQNQLNRAFEQAMFEAREGIRLNDFESAERARLRREQIENQQLQLQTLGTVIDFLAVMGQNPQLAGAILNNPQLSSLLGQFGINADAMFGAGAIPADQLPNAQQFTALPPAAQQNLLNALSAQFGLQPEVIRQTIMQNAPGGTRRAERAS